LAIAWGGTAMLVGPVGRMLGDPRSTTTQLLGQLALWSLLAAVLVVVRVWERQPLTSLGLNRLTWKSVGWAVVLALLYVLLLFPLTEAARTALGLEGYSQGMRQAMAMPMAMRVVAVVTAGVVEEALFRGYAVTRLIQLLRNPASAAIISSAAFAVLHLPMWGPGPSASFFMSSLFMTAFFIWRRDLWTMILAHVAIDAWGLIVSPGLSKWWT
jgi:membrane protease YdiL (CAAX protease family)